MNPAGWQGQLQQLQQTFAAEQQALQNRYNQQLLALRQGLMQQDGNVNMGYQTAPVQQQQQQMPQVVQRPPFPDVLISNMEDIKGLLKQLIELSNSSAKAVDSKKPPSIEELSAE